MKVGTGNCKGVTLIELLIVLVIVVLVLAAAFWSFVKLFQGFKSQTKVSETHLSSMISMELLRKDIELAGFGIPCYDENGTELTPFTLNDNTGNGGSDRLLIRSVFNPYKEDETMTWGFFFYDHNAPNPCRLIKGGENDFVNGEYVIITDDSDNRTLRVDSGGDWKFTINSSKQLNKCPDNVDDNHFYLVYVVSDTEPKRPYNYVEYYLGIPSSSSSGMPKKCASGTYEFYRAQFNNKKGTGGVDKQPMLDCVKNFQVAFKTDSGWSSSPPTSVSEQRSKIEEVRIFILQQEGQKEREEVSAGTSITLGDSDTGNLTTFTPTGDDTHYRWRVKEISIKPMNLGR